MHKKYDALISDNDDRKNEVKTKQRILVVSFYDYNSALCPLTWLVGVWSSLGILSPDYLDLNGMAILFLIINRQLLKYSRCYLCLDNLKCEVFLMTCIFVGAGKKKWRSLKSKSGASSSVHSGECAYIVPCRGDLNGSSDTISPTELPHMHNSSKGVKYSASVKEEMGGNNLNTLNEADDEYDSHRLKLNHTNKIKEAVTDNNFPFTCISNIDMRKKVKKVLSSVCGTHWSDLVTGLHKYRSNEENGTSSKSMP
ncbi:unnamed protein product [Onchocerca flexuosa]|uniref:Thioredoxin-like_fold domain-containing protein n=1 Tax=Onchocerca flexuosa TaxID=387005 RepID=A0A183I0G8_9BILA|nr:unnamed protein product [Onchocerca flexuosa]